MERQQLTLGALSEINSTSQTGDYTQTTGEEKGTLENPYLKEEIDPLIDNGTFGGGVCKRGRKRHNLLDGMCKYLW